MDNIQERFLNKSEFMDLMLSAPKSETKYIFQATNGFQQDPYQWIVDRAVDLNGLIINNRPIYFGVLTENINHRYEVWTVVNSDVKEQFTLYKLTKRLIRKWAEKYGKIYATMEKINPKNMAWTEKLGFKRINETENEITFLLERKK